MELALELFNFTFGVGGHLELLAPLVLWVVVIARFDGAVGGKVVSDKMLELFLLSCGLLRLVKIVVALLGVADVKADFAHTGCLMSERIQVLGSQGGLQHWIACLRVCP